MAKKKGKNVVVDKLWRPHMLQKLSETTGIAEGKWITFRKIMNICSNNPRLFQASRGDWHLGR